MFNQLRQRVSTGVQDMAINKSNYNEPSNPPARSSVLFRLTSWARIGVRARFKILDILINCALLTPLAVLFQVSSCGIQNALFLDHVPSHIGTLLLLLIGFSIEFGCSFWQEWLSSVRYVKGRKQDDAAYVVSTRLYHLAIGFANVCHYNGVTNIYYYWCGDGAYAAIQATVTTAVLLLSLKCSRNVLGAPLAVGVDSSIEDFFQTSTLYRTQKPSSYVRHAADHSATVAVVASLCFLHWIVVWTFFDRFIFPDNLAVSVVVSWLIGYSIVALAFLLEPHAVKISKSLESRSVMSRTLFEDVFLLLSNVGVILVWRGHWVFFESLIYYFPIYHNGADITSFYGLFSSFLMMCLLHSSSMLILKGCDYDGELTEGQGVQFSVDYFACFFQEAIEHEEAVELKEAKRAETDKKNQAKTFLTSNNNTAQRPQDKKGSSLSGLAESEQKKRR